MDYKLDFIVSPDSGSIRVRRAFISHSHQKMFSGEQKLHRVTEDELLYNSCSPEIPKV